MTMGGVTKTSFFIATIRNAKHIQPGWVRSTWAMKFVWPDSFIKVYATAKHLSPGDWWMLWRYSAQKNSRNIWRKQRFLLVNLKLIVGYLTDWLLQNLVIFPRASSISLIWACLEIRGPYKTIGFLQKWTISLVFCLLGFLTTPIFYNP